MDKVISARVDESVVERITGLARQLRTSKKSVIEQAITAFAARMEAEGHGDIFKLTSGAWRRSESPARTVHKTRAAFRKWSRRESAHL
ncbi:MAG: ribbon-helix-helix protein, CopG family [Chlamydiota bacterium]